MRLARRLGGRTGTRWLGLGLLLVAVLVLSLLALRTPGPAGAARPTSHRLLLVSGGSLSSGVGDAVLRRLRWTGRVVVHPDAGISRAIDPETPLPSAVRTDGVDVGDDVIAVQGGEVDELASPNAVLAGTYELLDWLIATKRPTAALVLGGPVPPALPASSGLVEVNEAMKAAARIRHVPYVDAIAAGWTVGDKRLVSGYAAALRAAVDAPPPSVQPSPARVGGGPRPLSTDLPFGDPTPSPQPSPDVVVGPPAPPFGPDTTPRGGYSPAAPRTSTSPAAASPRASAKPSPAPSIKPSPSATPKPSPVPSPVPSPRPTASPPPSPKPSPSPSPTRKHGRG